MPPETLASPPASGFPLQKPDHPARGLCYCSTATSLKMILGEAQSRPSRGSSETAATGKR